MMTYLVGHGLLMGGLGALYLFSQILKKIKRHTVSISELRLNYGVIIVALICMVIYLKLPSGKLFTPLIKEAHPLIINNFIGKYEKNNEITTILKKEVSNKYYFPLSQIFLFFVLIVSGRQIATLFKEWHYLHRVYENSFIVKRFRKTYVMVNSQINTPFSFWWWGRNIIVVPDSFVTNPTHYRIAVMHEIQHHRQGDTRWVYLLWGLRCVFGINPLIQLWCQKINRLQEFACDETLIGHHRVSLQSYARCLLEAAELALFPTHKKNPQCAAALTFMSEKPFLKQRIEKMLMRKKQNQLVGKSLNVIFFALVFSAMGIFVLRAADLKASQDREITQEKAELMAEKARIGSKIPIEINSMVLEKLNEFLGTPEKRKWFRTVLKYKQALEKEYKLSEHFTQSPRELLAIPIIESGYDNLLPTGNSTYGAGIWMFIESTARANGLVNRQDIVQSTISADRFLQKLIRIKEFNGSWPLAVLSYNIGDKKTKECLKKYPQKTIWEMVAHAECSGDKNYLAQLIAAIIIMKNPEEIRK